MREGLSIAVAQPRLSSGEVAGNARIHAEVVRAASARVVVFPELSLTGYELGAPLLHPSDGMLTPIVAACGDTGSTALVGAPVADDEGRPTIAMLAVDATGARVVYRKQWLGTAETARFHPGPAPAVLEVDWWRLGLAICKDTRIAQHAADTAALGIDAYVAGMVETEADAAAPETRARRVAAEHGVWVAIASWAGPTGGGFDRTAGRSGIWRPDGSTLAQAGAEPEAIIRATLTMAPAAPGLAHPSVPRRDR
jgi:predicted amidohydrolase